MKNRDGLDPVALDAHITGTGTASYTRPMPKEKDDEEARDE